MKTETNVVDEAPEGEENDKPKAEARRPTHSKKGKKSGEGKGHRKAAAKKRGRPKAGALDYPRHSVRDALRIPRALLEQNAGRECTDREAAKFAGVGYHGWFRVELSSAIKYGFLSRPGAGKVELTELAKKVLRPQNPDDEIHGLRQAVLTASRISDVYKHYRARTSPTSRSSATHLLISSEYHRRSKMSSKQFC